MISKKLEALLHKMSGHDLNRFRKFLTSPYFNENKELEMLLDWVAIEHAKKENSKDSLEAKQAIWKKIFGKKPYNDGHMRRLISELIRHALSFLALESFRKESFYEQMLLLNILDEPDFDLHLAGVVRQIKADLDNSVIRNKDFHYRQYLLEDHLYRYIEKFDPKPEMLTNLKRADLSLDCFYFTQKLKYYCDALEHQNILPVEANIKLLPNFLEWLKDNDYLKELSIKAYFLVAKMLLFPEQETHYYELKTLLHHNYLQFSKKEAHSLYIHLINYCIDARINKGDVGFFDELFSIYLNMLDAEILIENDLIDPQHYKLIITIGLQVKEFSWVEHFIQAYTGKLPPEEQENAKIYNLAKVYFQQNQYNKVIELLREVEYQNHTYALGGKLMLLKTYYELNEYLALDSLVDSFRIYLMRNKMISKEIRQQYLNVLRFVKKLSKVMPGDTDAIAKIRREIDDCKALADKNWILQKIAELEN